MKKILLVIMVAFSVCTIKAQNAVEVSKWYDNISAGVFGGVSTPLDFNSVFPINPLVGIRVQKDFTPVWGLQAEGLVNLNDNHFTFSKTAVANTNVGLNGIMNLSNGFGKQKNRVFEILAVAGLGWTHYWDSKANYLSAKTGLDLNFNLGKGHSLVLTPAVYWNLNKSGEVEFNKNNAQLALTLGYVYHFKNSNGTHGFKFYDIDALNNEINYLKEELAKKPAEVIVKEIEYVPSGINITNPFIVMFAKGSSNLSASAIKVLRSIPLNSKVSIIATASPEGDGEFNLNLSQERANSVKHYLEAMDIEVVSATGIGVQGETSNRVAVINIVE